MVMPYHLHMPSYFLETFTEYPFLHRKVFVLYLVICFIKYCRQVRVQFHLQSEVLSPFIIGEV